jgi:hypothetical protein
MSELEKIRDRLRKKEQEIQSLEEKLRSARVYVHALQDILKLIGSEKVEPSIESTLKAGSGVAQARDVILKKGVPVHVTELLSALGKELTRESRASLTSSIAAYVRRGEVFTRPAPNTFGLLELGHASISGIEEEPPTGFGSIKSLPAEEDEEVPF